MIRTTLAKAAGLLACALALAGASAGAAAADDIKVALITGKTGPFEAYAKETENGFMLGLEYLTKGTMAINGRKIKVIVKDDQSKPDLGRTLLAEAYGDDHADIAVGTSSSGSAIAMLPVAAEYKKVLVVEPAVADAITGEKWNRYIFRTSRNSMQDGLAAASLFKGGSVAFLAQDYAFGRVDGLVNNAGVTADAQLTKMSEAQFDRVIGVNLKGVYNCTRASVEALIASSGAIVNISSIVGLSGNFGQTNYAAAKAGVLGMSKTWARELGRKGVRSNAVCPGFVDTPILQTMPEKVIEEMVAQVPQRRMGQPREIAAAVVFLLSSEASYINGATLEVTGGLTL